MTREEKDKIIVDLYKKRLSFLKGDLDEDSYFSYVDNDTVDKLCTNKNGYKDLNAKLKATKTFINNYFKSIPSLDNIDKLNELKELEKKYSKVQRDKKLVDYDKNMEYIYTSFINYSRGIGKNENDNEKRFIKILDDFNYKSVDLNTRITSKNVLSTKYNFFREKACTYYVDKFHKKRVDFIRYIKSLEESKKIKYLKTERKEEETLSNIRELLYVEYIKYLNDLTTEVKLVNFAKKNNINLFSNSDDGFLTSNDIMNAIKVQSNIYAREVVGDLDVLNYLRNYGPLVTRLKSEGKIPLYNESEVKIITKIYDNFINYYDMKIDYDTYIKNEVKLVDSINSNLRSLSNKKNSKFFINYYLKNIKNTNISMNSIINNSNLYRKCFSIFKDFSHNIIDPSVKDFIDKYRVNIYNCALAFSKENNIKDLFNEMDQRRKSIINGNYSEIREIDYKDLVNEYINSKYYLEDFISEKDIDKKEFLNYIKYLKNTDSKLYVKYNSSLIGNKGKKDKYIDNRINGLYSLVTNGIPSQRLNKNRKFKLLDFYLYCDKFLYDIDRLIKLSKDILKDKIDNELYLDLLKSVRTNNNYIDKEYLYTINVTYKGNSVNRLDINYIVEYINKYNMPLTMRIFSEVLIRYFDNNLLDLGEEVLKLKDKSYKSFDFIKNSDNIEDNIYLPQLGYVNKNNRFKIIKTNYGYRVNGIKRIDNDYELIKSDKEYLKKLLNKIIKEYGIIINLDDKSDTVSLITKYTTYNVDNKYACEMCSYESDDSNDFIVKRIIDDDVNELYNTYSICKSCSEKFDNASVNDKIRLLTNVRNRIEVRLENYLDSFDKYVLIDNFDKIAYSLEQGEDK